MSRMKLLDVQDELRERAPVFAARVAPIYRLLGWAWGGADHHIPNEKEICETILHLIDHMDDVDHTNGTGGLWVYSNADEKTFGIYMAIEENCYR